MGVVTARYTHMPHEASWGGQGKDAVVAERIGLPDLKGPPIRSDWPGSVLRAGLWQLQGRAGGRQVPNATAALEHNLGLGGAAVLTIYQNATA